MPGPGDRQSCAQQAYRSSGIGLQLANLLHRGFQQRSETVFASCDGQLIPEEHPRIRRGQQTAFDIRVPAGSPVQKECVVLRKHDGHTCTRRPKPRGENSVRNGCDLPLRVGWPRRGYSIRSAGMSSSVRDADYGGGTGTCRIHGSRLPARSPRPALPDLRAPGHARRGKPSALQGRRASDRELAGWPVPEVPGGKELST